MNSQISETTDTPLHSSMRITVPSLYHLARAAVFRKTALTLRRVVPVKMGNVAWGFRLDFLKRDRTPSHSVVIRSSTLRFGDYVRAAAGEVDDLDALSEAYSAFSKASGPKQLRFGRPLVHTQMDFLKEIVDCPRPGSLSDFALSVTGASRSTNMWRCGTFSLFHLNNRLIELYPFVSDITQIVMDALELMWFVPSTDAETPTITPEKVISLLALTGSLHSVVRIVRYLMPGYASRDTGILYPDLPDLVGMQVHNPGPGDSLRAIVMSPLRSVEIQGASVFDNHIRAVDPVPLSDNMSSWGFCICLHPLNVISRVDIFMFESPPCDNVRDLYECTSCRVVTRVCPCAHGSHVCVDLASGVHFKCHPPTCVEVPADPAEPVLRYGESRGDFHEEWSPRAGTCVFAGYTYTGWAYMDGVRPFEAPFDDSASVLVDTSFLYLFVRGGVVYHAVYRRDDQRSRAYLTMFTLEISTVKPGGASIVVDFFVPDHGEYPLPVSFPPPNQAVSSTDLSFVVPKAIVRALGVPCSNFCAGKGGESVLMTVHKMSRKLKGIVREDLSTLSMASTWYCLTCNKRIEHPDACSKDHSSLPSRFTSPHDCVEDTHKYYRQDLPVLVNHTWVTRYLPAINTDHHGHQIQVYISGPTYYNGYITFVLPKNIKGFHLLWQSLPQLLGMNNI